MVVQAYQQTTMLKQRYKRVSKDLVQQSQALDSIRCKLAAAQKQKTLLLGTLKTSTVCTPRSKRWDQRFEALQQVNRLMSRDFSVEQRTRDHLAELTASLSHEKSLFIMRNNIMRDQLTNLHCILPNLLGESRLEVPLQQLHSE